MAYQPTGTHAVGRGTAAANHPLPRARRQQHPAATGGGGETTSARSMRSRDARAARVEWLYRTALHTEGVCRGRHVDEGDECGCSAGAAMGEHSPRSLARSLSLLLYDGFDRCRTTKMPR